MKKQTFVFDKFIEDIVQREQKNIKESGQKTEDSPQRKYNKLYQELWQNRIIWGPRNEK
jgi:hypothetical protein